MLKLGPGDVFTTYLASGRKVKDITLRNDSGEKLKVDAVAQGDLFSDKIDIEITIQPDRT